MKDEKKQVSRALTFNEAHILLFNLGMNSEQGREAFLLHLDKLYENTEDKYLQEELLTLKEKIESLMQAEFDELRRDVLDGTILIKGNYKLSHISF